MRLDAGRYFFRCPDFLQQNPRDTILRWIREGKIRDVSRDYKNHRVWTEKDIQEFQEFARNIFKRGNL